LLLLVDEEINVVGSGFELLLTEVGGAEGVGD
jgi:hypothetical protein